MFLAPPRKSRIRGALLGAALGDAFGSPLEGAGREHLLSQLAHRARSSGPWGFTDDTMMFVAVAESICEVGTIVPEALLGAFARRYEPARGFGRGMKMAIRAFERGVPWSDVARVAWPEGSRGNGGAVRVGAVALRAWATSHDLVNAAALATRVTHASEEAIGAALLQAKLLELVLTQPATVSHPRRLLEELSSALPRTSAIGDMLTKIRFVVVDVPDADIAKVCGTSPLARESVTASISSFLRAHCTFSEAVVEAASLGGDVDSICAIVGCLAGAYHGVEAIPSNWLHAILHESPAPAALFALADAIADLPPCGCTAGSSC